MCFYEVTVLHVLSSIYLTRNFPFCTLASAHADILFEMKKPRYVHYVLLFIYCAFANSDAHGTVSSCNSSEENSSFVLSFSYSTF